MSVWCSNSGSPYSWDLTRQFLLHRCMSFGSRCSLGCDVCHTGIVGVMIKSVEETFALQQEKQLVGQFFFLFFDHGKCPWAVSVGSVCGKWL